MQKTMFPALVATRIIPDKLILFTVLMVLASSGLFAQQQNALIFIDSLTNIITQQNKISNQVLAYEKKLQELTDSIALIQQQLIAVIEDPSNPPLTKEKAVNVLAGIHNEEVLQYLLKNERSLRFGAMDPLDTDGFDEETTRTAMLAILNEYLSKAEVNWMVFPFIFKYVETAGFSEIGLVRKLYGYENEQYRNSWYLLKFMQANANPALKRIIEGELKVVKEPEDKR